MTITPGVGCRTVVSEVVAHDLCIGCGACAAVCPTGKLSMTWSLGCLVSSDGGTACDKKCGLCLKVCPFADGNADEDALAEAAFGTSLEHRRETGFYRECLCGYAPAQRPRSASGGLASWYLADLLADGTVDHVLCVTPNKGTPLFSYRVLDTPEQVLASGGSAYYPVEMSGVLRHVLRNEGRYAIVGLPCFVKALRLACSALPALRRRVTHIIGLACGHGSATYFAEYCARKAGLHGSIQSVRFRKKCPDRSAQDYAIEIECDNGIRDQIHNSEGPGQAWTGWWFVPNACSFCDDLFAECADVTFMDAWLPEYIQEPQGTNLVIVRTENAVERLRHGAESGRLSIASTGVDDVVKSQRNAFRAKVVGLPYRARLAHNMGLKVPQKRNPVNPRLNWIDRMLQQSLFQMAHRGASVWCDARSTSGLHTVMRYNMLKARTARIMTKAIRSIRGLFARKDLL
jgi:coenzyme F420 hydrogenase subunit beta